MRCIELASEHSSSVGDNDASLCPWPSKLVASAKTLVSVYDTGGEAGGARDSGAQGVTLVQPYVTGAGNDGAESSRQAELSLSPWWKQR